MKNLQDAAWKLAERLNQIALEYNVDTKELAFLVEPVAREILGHRPEQPGRAWREAISFTVIGLELGRILADEDEDD